ncbi:MAG: amino acid transport protein [Oligoflexus sp.]|jgi:hypothetical protein
MSVDVGWLILVLFTSGLGLIYFNFGRKNSRPAFLFFGMALMMYGYFIDSTLALGLIGAGLAAGPFLVTKLV